MSYDAVNDWTVVTDEDGDLRFKLAGDVTLTLTNANFVFAAGGPQGGPIWVGTGGGDSMNYAYNNGGTFYGGGGNDTIIGGNGVGNISEVMRGGDGNDSINGRDGEYLLEGGSGRDTLTGGTWSDVFEFRNLSHSQLGSEDLITDFENNADRISLRGLGFTALTDFENRAYDGGSNTTLIHDVDTNFAIRFSGNVLALLDNGDFFF